jgi:hypothetical protein
MDYVVTICIDAAVVVLAAAALLRFGQPGHSHPGVLYLAFHLYTITWRQAAIAFGSPTLFSHSFWGASAEPVTDAEIMRAVMVADAALAVMTLGWIWARRSLAKRPTTRTERWARPIRQGPVWAVAAVAIPVGVVALALFARLPGRGAPTAIAGLGEWSTSSYFLIIQSWAGLGIVALIYLHGFKPALSAAALAYIALMAIQGFHRYRAIIPVILLVQLYLDRNGRRWPTKTVLALLVGVGLAFFPLKVIGGMVVSGATWDEVVDAGTKELQGAVAGDAPDQLFLDQLASTISLVDANGVFYWGEPYAAILTLPVPRQWWPEKPSIADYIKDFSRPWRPMHENGMITTLIGELYANFSFAGVILASFLVAYALARMYFSSQRYGYWSVARFTYLMVACNLVQVYRDGLVSLPMFAVVNMLPLAAIVLLHVARGTRPTMGRAEPLHARLR